MPTQPQVIVLAGPNGAGKSTTAAPLLPQGMIFVNADEVAKGLPGYPSRAVDLQASRLVLDRMDKLEQARLDFAVETTPASRTLASRIVRLRKSGYGFRLVYIWMPSADLAVRRVVERVRWGGHHIPEETIRRRGLYEDTVPGDPPPIIAEGIMGEDVRIYEPIFGSSRDGECLMDDHGRGILGKRDATGEEIRHAMGYAIREAVRDHKRAGNPIAVWDREKNGVVIVPPEQIVVPDEDDVRDEAVKMRIEREEWAFLP